tara:strand:+ start:15439 stop:16200 length:762 start_codon:yes stop_codon:yes gene_type:complete
MKIIALISIFISFSLSAYTLEGELTPAINGSVSLEEGAIFEGVLRVWPVPSDWKPEHLLTLDKKKLGENFHIIKVLSSELSAHNQDVAELKAVVAVVKALKPKDRVYAEIAKQRVPLEIRRITTIATAPAAQEFTFVEQPSIAKKNQEKVLAYVGGASSSIIILALIIFAIYKVRKNTELKKLKNSYRDRIISASSRDEVESLARDLPKLEKVITLKQTNEFKQKLNEIQFKREWSDSELQNIIKIKQELINE